MHASSLLKESLNVKMQYEKLIVKISEQEDIRLAIQTELDKQT